MPEVNNLTCQDFVNFLSDYIDGDLKEQQKCVFDDHVGVCSDCRNYLDSYKKTMKLASSVVANDALSDDVPPELIKAIFASRTAGRGKYRIC